MRAGQVGIADHVTVRAAAVLGAQAGLMADVPAGAHWIGSPAHRAREFMKPITSRRGVVRNDGKPGEEGE